jgi:hypothetical protein
MQDELLSYVKLALRITTNAFDDEIVTLIESARQDLGIAGVVLPYGCDAITRQAITTYCKLHFGTLSTDYEYRNLKASYDEQKAQLQMASGYTNWKVN